MAISKVIVVGAGPSGLLLALLLAKKGISVEVLEQNHDLDPSPRATHYAPPAVYELRRAGIMDQLRKEGFEPGGVCWRKPDGSFIAGLDNEDMVSFDRMICLSLQRVSQILYEHLIKHENASVKYGHKVLSLGQDKDQAWIDVEVENEGKKRFSADYIVGCDGANSQIRRSLFGDLNFPGRSWDEQIVATNVRIFFRAEQTGNPLTRCRCTTTLISSGGGTQTSSWIRMDTTWLQRSPGMACTASHTARPLVFHGMSCSHACPRNSKRCCLGTRSRTNTSS